MDDANLSHALHMLYALLIKLLHMLNIRLNLTCSKVFHHTTSSHFYEKYVTFMNINQMNCTNAHIKHKSNIIFNRDFLVHIAVRTHLNFLYTNILFYSVIFQLCPIPDCDIMTECEMA